MGAFNGSGVFVRSYSWASDAINGILVRSDRTDTEDNGFASGLSNTICKDGQQTTTARIPFAVGLGLNQGSVTAPALSITGDTQTGFYQVLAGEIRFGSNGTYVSALNANGWVIGTNSITDTGVLGQFTGSATAYNQVLVQNTNNAVTSSADFVVANNNGTATTFYGDFGINSSTFTGTGSLNIANATYLYSVSGDLVLGTQTSNAIHMVVNNGAADALTIGTSGAVTIQGTITNDNAASGYVGEFISSAVVIGSPVALSNGTPANITTISLTAGDWDVYGNVGLTGTGTVSSVVGSIALSTGGIDGNTGADFRLPISQAAGADFDMAVGTRRVTLSTTSTVYLTTSVIFSGSKSGFGFLGARRRR